MRHHRSPICPPNHRRPWPLTACCSCAPHSLELRNLLAVMDENELREMKTMINVGCEFYMNATVPATDRVYVDVGLGVHVDFSRPEALAFIQQREAAYNALSDEYTQEMARIQDVLAGGTGGVGSAS